jgi:hypothetical protein
MLGRDSDLNHQGRERRREERGGEGRGGEQAYRRDKQRGLFVLGIDPRRASAAMTRGHSNGQDDDTHLALVVVHVHALGGLGRHAHPPVGVDGGRHAAGDIGNRLHGGAGADDAER